MEGGHTSGGGVSSGRLGGYDYGLEGRMTDMTTSISFLFLCVFAILTTILMMMIRSPSNTTPHFWLAS